MAELRARVEAMTKAGLFGPPGISPFVRDNNGEHQLGLQFASEIQFFRIGLDRGGPNEYEEIRVAVKTQLKGEKERTFTSNGVMFFNEAYMYGTIIPYIGAENLFPKCFHSDLTAVVTQDVKPFGFVVANGHTLDYTHLKIALRSLGKFHGLSYKAKHLADFMSKVNNLKSVTFDDDEFDTFLLATARRGIQPLTSDQNHNSSLSRLTGLLANGRRVLKSLKTPEEPFAVVCHGEFHKSNILFSYHEESGEAQEAVFLDLQMSSYSDPSTDISFLLYMNSTQRVRSEHRPALLTAYWDGLRTVLPNPGFTFQQFLANFERKCVYGYLPTSIFLPIIYDEVEANESIEEFLSHPLTERIAIMDDMGGDEATETLKSVVTDLIDRGYVDKFLEHFETLQ